MEYPGPHSGLMWAARLSQIVAASHNDVQSHHCRREVLGPLTLEIWRSRNNAEEPRFGGALPRLRALSPGGRPPRIRYPQTCLSGNERRRIALILPTHRCTGRCRPILSTCGGLSWPGGSDWQCWVGRYLDVRAVVVAVISIPIESVLAHPKDDLQRAFLAVDVGEPNVGLMK